MTKKSLKQTKSTKSKKSDRNFKAVIVSWWSGLNLIKKIFVGILIAATLWVGGMYAIAQWYIFSNRDKPLTIGATFIADYARQFNLDPKETLDATINDLGVKHLRLVSYWKIHEEKQGIYDFSELDWQFAMAEKANVPVSLAIGLRQPRWPECHAPKWAENMPMEQWAPLLKNYMGAVIDRYKDSPVLESYQLENEMFMTVFGICPDHSRDRLIDEFNFVKARDPNHPVIISRSNNAVGLPVGKPRPDMFGVSVYKRVFDKNVTHRYFEYPFPAWFYGFLAGAGKIVTGKDMIIHELQAEAWPPDDIQKVSKEEQDKSMNPKRLKDRIQYGVGTGMRTMDLWGVEWWYWQKVHYNDPGLWNTAKESIAELH